MVNKVLHFVIIILPVGESVNLLLVIFFHFIPFSLVFLFNSREVTRCYIGFVDLFCKYIDLSLTVSDVLINILNLSLDEGVLVFDELTTTAVSAKVSSLIRFLKLLSG